MIRSDRRSNFNYNKAQTMTDLRTDRIVQQKTQLCGANRKYRKVINSFTPAAKLMSETREAEDEEIK